MEVNFIAITISAGYTATEDALGFAWSGTTTTNAAGCVVQTGQIHQACWDSTAGVLTLKNAVDGLTLLRAAAQVGAWHVFPEGHGESLVPPYSLYTSLSW